MIESIKKILGMNKPIFTSERDTGELEIKGIRYKNSGVFLEPRKFKL